MMREGVGVGVHGQRRSERDERGGQGGRGGREGLRSRWMHGGRCRRPRRRAGPTGHGKGGDGDGGGASRGSSVRVGRRGRRGRGRGEWVTLWERQEQHGQQHLRPRWERSSWNGRGGSGRGGEEASPWWKEWGRREWGGRRRWWTEGWTSLVAVLAVEEVWEAAPTSPRKNSACDFRETTVRVERVEQQ